MTKDEALNLKIGDLVRVNKNTSISFFVDEISKVEGFGFFGSKFVRFPDDSIKRIILNDGLSGYCVLVKTNQPLEKYIERSKRMIFYHYYKDIVSEGFVSLLFSALESHKDSNSFIDRVKLIDSINSHRIKFGQNKLDASNWLDSDLEIECRRLNLI